MSSSIIKMLTKEIEEIDVKTIKLEEANKECFSLIEDHESKIKKLHSIIHKNDKVKGDLYNTKGRLQNIIDGINEGFFD